MHVWQLAISNIEGSACHAHFRRYPVKPHERPRKMKSQTTCAECGETFILDHESRKYCSSKCKRDNDNRVRREMRGSGGYKPKPCSVCGKEYLPTSSNSKICSRECRLQIKRERAKNYG